MNQQPVTRAQAIESRIDTRAVAAISGTGGTFAIDDLMQGLEVAKLMAISEVAVPKHLRGNPGACLGVVYQAKDWGMSPFAVANKSYSVNDRLGYESQMIQAVILSRAPIKDGIDFAFDGEGPTRRCIATCETLTGRAVTITSPKLSEIKVKNSPLWAADPDQQLTYYTGRALCRRYFPQVLLGVYDREELEAIPKDVAANDSGLVGRLQANNANEGGFSAEGVATAISHTTGNETSRYFFHPESESFVVTSDGSAPEKTDGHLEEIDKDRYFELQAKLQAKTVELDPEMERAGAQAFVDGQERRVPEDMSPDNAVAWLHGYDAVSGGGA